MIAELLIFFALLSLITTAVVVLVPGVIRTRAWLGVPLGALVAAAAAVALRLLTGDVSAAEFLFLWAVVMGVVARLLLDRWSYLASLLLASVLLAGVVYLIYSVLAAVVDPLGAVVWFGTVLLLLLELVALGLSLSYAFEVLDVLSRRERPRHPLDPYYRPLVAIQVPTYNEPVEVVSRTLESLALLEYSNYFVQVVDNNTKDPLVWRPLEALCENLGPRFQFIHLENWPGYKAGALNEATRRLPREVEIVAIVDADYVVDPGFLRATVGHFADPRVAFVQTPQNYRDWEDDRYLRGLFFSYRYFFDVTMPARANRNAIIFAGTMGLMRRSALEGIGGWSTETVTEDAEASLRMLGQGYTGVYVPEAYGSGLMPLSFDGLKKQRFRWALGGIQILRMHWRELLPFAPHRLRLTVAQRIHYLLGSVQWFGDVLTVAFTVLLLLTAAVTVVHHRLPVREIVGPLSLVPVLFLVTGVGRALWAIRVTARKLGCTFGDSVRCLRCWFALSWVVTLACVRGLVRRQAAFLRTPKRADRRSVWQAIRASRAESLIAALAALGGVGILVSAFSVGTVALAVLLLWLAYQFSSAPWASFAAEGIHLTPLRAAYKRSSQSTGEWPEGTMPVAIRLLVPAAIIAAAAVGALLLLTPSAPSRVPATPDLPPIQQRVPPVAVSTPTPTRPPTPTPTATPTPTPTATPAATPTPRATPTATAPVGTPTPRPT